MGYLVSENRFSLIGIKIGKNAVGKDHSGIKSRWSVDKGLGIVIGNKADFGNFYFIVSANCFNKLSNLGIAAIYFFNPCPAHPIKPAKDDVGNIGRHQPIENI